MSNLFPLIYFFRNLLDKEELLRVKQVLEDNDEIVKNAFGVGSITLFHTVYGDSFVCFIVLQFFS